MGIAKGLLNTDPVLLDGARTFFGLTIDGNLELAQMAIASLYDRTRGAVTIPVMLAQPADEISSFQFKTKLPIRLLAVGGQYSIPNMGEALQPYFENVASVVIPDGGHFVPGEQPEALHKALRGFL